MSRYRILGLVGQGQFGKVYCAMHRQTGKLFALKNLERERFPTHQFLRELRFLLSLQHPNIVTCHAVEHTATGRYLVMDYCEGGTLRSLMVDDVELPLRQGIQLVVDVLKGLDEAHHQKIIHCDVKPENVLLTFTPKGWAAKISDFGIARLNQEAYDRTAGNTGSPAYMAPERFYSQYSLVSDLYAVGVMMFELLVGHRPFNGPPKALMAAHLNQVVEFPETISPNIPDALKAVVNTALEKLPARRFQSAREMLAAIDQAVANLPILSPQQTLTVEPPLLILRQMVPCYEGFPQQHTELSAPVTLMNGWRSPSAPSTSTTLEESPPLQDGQRYTTENIGDVLAQQKHGPCHIGYVDTAHFHIQQYQRRSGSQSSIAEIGEQGSSAQSAVTLPLLVSAPIQQLLVAPQGYLLVTRRVISWVDRLKLNRLSSDTRGFLSNPDEHFHATAEQVAVQPIYHLEQDCVVTVEPTGHWLALVTDSRQSNLENAGSTLSFHPLPRRPSPMALPQCSTRLRAASKAETLLTAIALDSRHVIVISDGPWRKPLNSANASQPSFDPLRSEVTSLSSPHPSRERATYLEMFTRRGTRIAIQRLPMLLGTVIATPDPYRLLATDQYDPTSVLCIDLKPFRVQRFALDIIPSFLMAAPWGNIVADTNGKVIFLDPTGYAVSALQIPSPLTAATFVPPHFLFTATWQDGKGAVYTFDLKQQLIDWVF